MLVFEPFMIPFDISLILPMMIISFLLAFMFLVVIPVFLGSVFVDLVVYKEKWTRAKTRITVTMLSSFVLGMVLLFYFGKKVELSTPNILQARYMLDEKARSEFHEFLKTGSKKDDALFDKSVSKIKSSMK